MIYTLTFNPGIDRTLVVPVIGYQTVLRAQKVYLNCGGKGFNVSRILNQFQIPNINVCFLGGCAGEIIKNDLVNIGFKIDCVKIEGETRNNIVIIEKSSNKHIKVNEPGPQISLTEQQLLIEKIKQNAKRDDYWAICGSLPPGVPSEFIFEVIEIINKAGGKVCLDTSGIPLSLGIKASPYLVKPNRLEANELTGIQINNIDQALKAAREMAKAGIQKIMITLEDEGLLFYNHKDAYHAFHPAVEIRNPTGAGDSVLAGFLYGVSNNLPITEILKWAVAAGTASAMKDEVASAKFEEIHYYYHQVQVEILN